MTTKEAQTALANLKLYISGGGVVDRGTNKAIDMAIKALEKPEPQWISCKDKLPPNEKKTYWVCLGNGSQCECRWTNDIYGFGEIDDRWGWSYLDKPRYSTIVAWRELPEPYKGVTE